MRSLWTKDVGAATVLYVGIVPAGIYLAYLGWPWHGAGLALCGVGLIAARLLMWVGVGEMISRRPEE